MTSGAPGAVRRPPAARAPAAARPAAWPRARPAAVAALVPSAAPRSSCTLRPKAPGMKPGQRGKDCCVALRRDTSLIQCMKKPGRPTAARRRLPVQSERKLEGAGRKQDLVTAALGEVRIAWFARTAAPSLELVPVTPIEHVQHVGTHPEAEVAARVPATFQCNDELSVADSSLRLERIVEAE